jgi:hypothetical protein
VAGIPTTEKRNIVWDPALESSDSAEGSADV